jgi:hypothetical protein
VTASLNVRLTAPLISAVAGDEEACGDGALSPDEGQAASAFARPLSVSGFVRPLYPLNVWGVGYRLVATSG